MEQKKWLIVLGILNVLAVAGIVFWYVNRDNTPPVITQENEIVYEETMSDSELLQGAVAIDETDGDVSHTLVVEKVTVNHNTGIAMVTCGAMDQAGNIAKQSFRMAMAESESSVEDSEGDRAEEVFTLAVGEAANGNIETAVDDEAENDEVNATTDSEDETTSEDGEDSDEATSDEENADENADGEDEDADSEDDAVAAQARAEEAARAQELADRQAEEMPILNFNAAEVITKQGYDPAWIYVISQLQDNKDSYEYLVRNLQIAGQYDNTTLGAYNVSVTTVDSDGNVSEARPIRIIVEE